MWPFFVSPYGTAACPRLLPVCTGYGPVKVGHQVSRVLKTDGQTNQIDQAWLDTEGFMNALDENLSKALTA